MKKTVIFALIIALIAITGCSPTANEKPIGEVLTLNIMLDDLDSLKGTGNGTLAGIQFIAKYNVAALTYADCKTALNDAFEESSFIADAKEQSPGEVMVMIMDNALRGVVLEGQTERVEFAQLKFNVTGEGTQEIDIEFVTACDTTGDDAIEPKIAELLKAEVAATPSE